MDPTKKKVPHFLRAKVRKRVRECLDIAERVYHREFPTPEIEFDIYNSNAGLADANRWRLHFNPVFLVENQRQFLMDTIPHEVGHLVNVAVNKRPNNSLRAHGQEWARIVRILGAVVSTCHNYNLNRRSQ